MIPQFFRPIALCGLLVVLASCAYVFPDREPAHNAVLLVGLEDGSMIRQEIPVDAEICMKALGDSATTCLTRAEPIMSDDGSRIIGYT